CQRRARFSKVYNRMAFTAREISGGLTTSCQRPDSASRCTTDSMPWLTSTRLQSIACRSEAAGMIAADESTTAIYTRVLLCRQGSLKMIRGTGRLLARPNRWHILGPSQSETQGLELRVLGRIPHEGHRLAETGCYLSPRPV